MPSYSTVFIDWYKTLSHDKFWAGWAAPGHAQNATFQALQVAFFADSASLVVPWMRGELIAEEAVARVALQVGVDERFLLAELEESCRAMRFVSPLAPDLIGALRGAGFRVVLATDNMDTFTRWTVPALRLDDLFDDILCSHDLGCLKGDVNSLGQSRFFGPYLAEWGISPRECVLIDDSVSLAAVVRAQGMDCRLVDGTTGLEGHLRLLVDGRRGQDQQRGARGLEATCRPRRYPAGY